MPTDPGGNFSLVPSYFAQPGTVIRTEQHNPVLEDIGQGISQRLMRDGRNGMVGNLNMGMFAIRNLAPGANPTDAATVSQVMPIGAVVDFAGVTAPTSWMLCYGQAISRTTYAALFALLGTTYGAGDGSTTFNLPDARGRVTAGKDNMGGTSASRLTSGGSGITGSTLGATGGAETHTLNTVQLPAHAHSGTTNSSGEHSHVYVDSYLPSPGGDIQSGPGFYFSATTSRVTNAAGLHAHSFTTGNAGSGAAHNNVQPTLVLNKIIKVSL